MSVSALGRRPPGTPALASHQEGSSPLHIGERALSFKAVRLLAGKCMVCVSPVSLFLKDSHFSRWERLRSDPVVGRWLRVPFRPAPCLHGAHLSSPRQWGLPPSQSASLESVSVQLPDCEEPL